MLEVLLDMIIKLGFPTAVAAYMIYRTDRRNDQTVARLASLEEWVRGTMTAALSENTDALRDARSGYREMIRALSGRPCLYGQTSMSTRNSATAGDS
jgi:hypothetical protein